MAEAVVNVDIEQLVSETNEWLNEMISTFNGVSNELEYMSIKIQLRSEANEFLTKEISSVTGVENELHNMVDKMKMIQKVLDDAENRSLRETFVQEWLDKLQDLSYEMEDVLDEWNTEMSSYSISLFTSFYGFNTTKQDGWRHDITSRIKIINQRVDSLLNQMDQLETISSKIRSVAPDALTMNNFEIDRSTTSLVNKSLIHGRDAETEELLRKLCVNNEGGDNISVVSIVGLGGLGKTTLAQLVYNDEKVIKDFEKRIWVCVSNTFDEVKVARAILEGLEVSHAGISELQTLHRYVQNSLSEHKFLLVLDDVWNEELGKWERLRACVETAAQGSRVLVTTRIDEVARIMNTSASNMLRPRLISENNCWLLMSHVAFHGKGKDDVRKFENIGKEIAKKCKGLPLAAKTLGGLLILKDTIDEWKEVLNSEIWELKKAETELFPHLILSYRDLPLALKRCFIFFSIFPKGYEIKVENLITLWIGNGYINPTKEIYNLERVGQKYFRYLLSHSFFQVSDIEEEKEDSSPTLASMHDIMHDFALHLSGNNFLTVRNDDSKPEPTSLKIHKSKKAHHLFINGKISFPVRDVGRLRTCFAKGVIRNVTLDMLRHLKLIRTLSLIECNLNEIPQEIGKLIHLRTLDLSKNYSIKELPETIGDLYNLKYLFLENLEFEKFPHSIGKLTNLRILTVDMDQWKLLAPESLSKLVNLQRLRKVHVEAGSRGLEFLKNLNQLHEKLKIVFESDYSDEVDANEAKLKLKKHIKKFTFNFKGKDVAEFVVDALEPSTEVKALKIVKFKGSKLPYWITSLDQLTKLEVSSAENIVCLPPLGKLPYLEKLKIHHLSSLKLIGRDFLGIDTNSDTGITIENQTPSSASSTIAFPALEELELSYLYELEKWEDLNVEWEDMTNVMPKLKSLIIECCPKLEVLPLLVLLKASPFMKRLVVDEIELPSDLRFTGEEVVEGTVEIVLPPFPNLQYIKLTNYTGPRLPSWISCLNYLTELQLYGVSEVQSLPPLGNLPCLKILSIEEFYALKFIGRDFLGIDIEKKVDTSIAAAAPVSSLSPTVSFPKLVKLRLNGLYELKEWVDITVEEDKSVNVMPNLQKVEIKQCPNLVVFPHRLFHKASLLNDLIIEDDKRRAQKYSSSSFEAVFGTLVTTILKLQHFTIREFMDPKLPSWIASLNYLTTLQLYKSKNVTSLPPLGKLPCLQWLIISNSSVLKLIGQEFLGMEEDNNQKNIISTSITSFPKLERLEIYKCWALEVWEDIKVEDVDDHSITLMPNLNYLIIQRCPKLQVLPHLLLRRASSPRELGISINGCGINVREKIVEDAELLLRLKYVRVDGEDLELESETEDISDEE